MNAIRIAIADDYKIFRDGLKVGLFEDEALQVVFEAGNGEELLEGLKKNEVDVILMDLKMPVMDGMEATKQVRLHYPQTKVLVVTMYDDDKFIVHLMENGANGYLLKNADSEEIRKSIYAVHENGYYFNDLVNKALLKRLVLKGDFTPSFNEDVELGEKEMEVLKRICAEKTVDEISEEMLLNTATIDDIIKQLITKIGVRNVAGLVMFAVKNGIVK